MNGYAASSPIWRAKWEAWVESIGRNWRVGAALLLSAPARAADPAELESKLTVTVDGVEKTLSLEKAKQALHIPSVSLALID